MTEKEQPLAPDTPVTYGKIVRGFVEEVVGMARELDARRGFDNDVVAFLRSTGLADSFESFRKVRASADQIAARDVVADPHVDTPVAQNHIDVVVGEGGVQETLQVAEVVEADGLDKGDAGQQLQLDLRDPRQRAVDAALAARRRGRI